LVAAENKNVRSTLFDLHILTFSVTWPTGR